MAQRDHPDERRVSYDPDATLWQLAMLVSSSDVTPAGRLRETPLNWTGSPSPPRATSPPDPVVAPPPSPVEVKRPASARPRLERRSWQDIAPKASPATRRPNQAWGRRPRVATPEAPEAPEADVTTAPLTRATPVTPAEAALQAEVRSLEGNLARYMAYQRTLEVALDLLVCEVQLWRPR